MKEKGLENKPKSDRNAKTTIQTRGEQTVLPGLVGEIIATEEVKTQVQGYTGIRCRVKTLEGEEYGEMLWERPEVGVKSKIGAFMSVFGTETDLWLHKWVRILKWEQKDREIEETTAKKPAQPTQPEPEKPAEEQPKELTPKKGGHKTPT